MASKTLGSLIVDLEMQTAKFDKRLASIDGRIKRFEKKTNNSINTIKKAFGGLIALETVRRATVGIVQIADRMTELQGRVKNATKDTGDFAKVWDELGGIARSTGANLNDTVAVFQRLSMARAELGATNSEMLRFTKSVQQLGVISGASTSAMSAGLTQLAQGLSAGVLRAEEFNSIVENIPAVAKAIADGMNLTVGELRQMVIQGKVLSSDVLESVLSQSKEIRIAFAEMPLTISRATNELSTSFDLLIARINESTGLTEKLANVLHGIAENWRLLFGENFQDRIDSVKREIKLLRELAESPWTFKGDYIDRIHELEAELRMLLFAQDRATQSVVKGSDALKKLGEAAKETSTEIDKMGGLIASKTGGVQKGLILANKKQQDLTESVRESKEEAARLSEEIANIELSSDFLRSIKEVDKELENAANTLSNDFVNALQEVDKELQAQAELAKLWEITWTEVMEDTIRSVRTAWSDFFLDIFQGKGIDSFKDFVDTIKDMFLRLIADLAAAWVTRNIFGGLLGIGGGSIFTGGAGILGGAASGGGGLLGGLLGGGAATSSGAGGAAVGGVAIAGAAGGAATVFPYVSATGTGVGGVIGGTALTGTGATVTSGAGGAAAAGTGALGGAAAALPYVGIMALALHLATSGGRNIGDILKGQTNFAKFGPGAGGATYDRADPFLESLQGRGLTGPGGPVNVTDVGSGLGFTSRTGREGDPLVNVQEMFEAFERLKDILPEIQAAGMEAFEGMKVPAEEMTEILGDGWVNAQERITLGLEGITGGIGSMGRVTTEQFGQIAAAVNNGELRLKALAGTVKFTENELKILGEIGVRSIDDISGSANALQSDLGEAKGAANSLANAIRDIPSIPSGARDIGGKHSGGSFEVRGRPGVDANLVQFMATAGERVTVKTPGTTEHAQAGADMSGLVNRMDRLISYLEAA